MIGKPDHRLWCVDLVAAGPALQAIEAQTPRLSGVEHQRAAAFTDAKTREEWLSAQIALRLALEIAEGAEWRGVPFERGPYGKPHLAAAPVGFSLSHAPGLALIGIAPSGAIGVDVEVLRPVRIAPPRRLRIEQAARGAGGPLSTVSDEVAFLQSWVRLEAIAKADGCGIGRLLTRLGVFGAGAREPVSDEEMRLRGEGLLACGPVRHVRDLQLGAGIFAALASGEKCADSAVSWLPTSVAGLQKLMI